MKLIQLEKEHEKLKKDNPTIAEDFYYQEIFPLVSQTFSDRVKDLQNKGLMRKYRYLIQSVGLSPEPLLMWIKALQPEKVFLLYTPDSEVSMEKICRVANLGWNNCERVRLDKASVEDVYAAIKNLVGKYGFDKCPQEVAIDSTGGKKSMTSGGAVAGYYLGIDVLYADFDQYHTGSRRPGFGSEIPTVLLNPIDYFGDREMAEGVTKFNAGNFSGAAASFQSTAEKVAFPRKYQALASIAMAYGAWDMLDYFKAKQQLEQAITLMNRFNVNFQFKPQLNDHLKLLEKLCQARQSPLTLFQKKEGIDINLIWLVFGDILGAAKRRMREGRFDMAVLLCYRALEMLTQYLLTQHGINASSAVYGEWENEIVTKVNEIGQELYGREWNSISVLPKKIALMMGLIILRAIGDEAVTKWDLQEFRIILDKRNRSIFAHGMELLSMKEAEDFYTMVTSRGSEVWYRRNVKEQFGDFGNFLKCFEFPLMPEVR